MQGLPVIDQPALLSPVMPRGGVQRNAGPGPVPAKRRHRAAIFGFILIVLLPLIATTAYLLAVAADQYASTTGFVVRQSDKTTSPAFEFLGGISSLTSASPTDATILYEFIQSQRMVELVDAAIDLRAIFSRPAFDPVFAFDPEDSIEDLTRHWGRMVKVSFDNSSGLIEIRVLAFTPEDAARISTEIVRQSTLKINELSAIAREDATRYAREDLDEAVDFLKTARQQMGTFRNRTQIIDPKADIQVQMGLIGTLQTQLAEAMIELDLMRTATRNDDPRIRQTEQRIAIIEERIRIERGMSGVGDPAGQAAFSDLVGQYESLAVDQQFAEQAYVAALATFNEARAEASRQTLYLATYIDPTTAEDAEYPRRYVLAGLIGLFLFLIWSIGTLVAYSAWDRR